MVKDDFEDESQELNVHQEGYFGESEELIAESDNEESDCEEKHSIGGEGEGVEGVIPCIDYFISEKLWNDIGKDLADFDIDDMLKLHWKSLEVCEAFYYLYASVKGFSVRKRNVNRSRRHHGGYTSRVMICNREGESNPKPQNQRVRRHRGSNRCHCKASIKFKFVEYLQAWTVESFVQDHTHELTSQKHMAFERGQRQVPSEDVIRIKALRKAGIRPRDIMRVIVDDAGSYAEVGYLDKEVYAVCNRIKKAEVKDGDAETVMAYLLGKMKDDPSLFVRFTRDADGRLEKIFWCDGEARVDYKAFGDVLAFDTTYKSNSYEKPFVVLVGVNNHRMTVPFGCALVVYENEDTFAWVLEQLIEAGDGHRPITVVTDGDKAMANAIKKVLPNARHRLCLWHLMRNVKAAGSSTEEGADEGEVTAKAKGASKAKGFGSAFMACVDKCRTVEDFQKCWKDFKDRFGLEGRKWAEERYADREKWAEAYMRGHFYAGLRSTQRCESMHALLKQFLDKMLFMYELMELYDKAVEKLRFKILHEEYKTEHDIPHIDKNDVLRNVKIAAAKVYTSNSFKVLCEEMSHEALYMVKNEIPSANEGGHTIYELVSSKNPKLFYIVINVPSQKDMYCSCMKYESIGYPCRHMFSVMKWLHMEEIPYGCIMKRWTRYAKEGLELPETPKKPMGDDRSVVMARYTTLSSFWSKICHSASQSREAFNEIKSTLAKLCLKFTSEEKAKTSQKRQRPTETLNPESGILDPKVVDTGRGKSKKTKVTGEPSSATGFDFDTFSMLKETIEGTLTNTYMEGSILEADYEDQINRMEEDPIVYDWQPNTDF